MVFMNTCTTLTCDPRFCKNKKNICYFYNLKAKRLICVYQQFIIYYIVFKIQGREEMADTSCNEGIKLMLT